MWIQSNLVFLSHSVPDLLKMGQMCSNFRQQMLGFNNIIKSIISVSDPDLVYSRLDLLIRIQ